MDNMVELDQKALAPQRWDTLRALIRDTGVIRIEDLCRRLGVSAATVRRDLDQLERGGAIRKRMQKVAMELGLTDEQKQRLQPILREEWTKLKALRDDQSLTRLEKRKKLQAMREELLPQLKGVLTPEQLAKWQQLRQERLAKAAPSAPQP